jgi:copper resistance protein C
MSAFDILRRGARAAAVAMAILMPCVAFAHVFPQKQSPSAGAEVSAPASVTIVFDGPLEPAFSSVTVSTSAGKQGLPAVLRHEPGRSGVPSSNRRVSIMALRRLG